MEQLNKAHRLLSAVLDTMDMIEVRGVTNQTHFVDCAKAVQSARQTLRQYILDNTAAANEETVKEERNG